MKPEHLIIEIKRLTAERDAARTALQEKCFQLLEAQRKLSELQSAAPHNPH